LGASLVGLCTKVVGAENVVLMQGHHESCRVEYRVDGKRVSVPLVNYRMSPKARLKEHLFWIIGVSILYHVCGSKGLRRVLARYTPWIKALEEADIVGDVRGGDSFSDIYGMGRFLIGFLAAWTAVLVKGSIVQFPQTFGPYKNPISRFLAKYLLRRSFVITARDRESQRLAQEYIGKSRQVFLCPDVAFSLEPVQPENIVTDPPFHGNLVPQGTIGLNVNGLMYNGGYSRNNMFGLKMDYRALLPKLIEALSKQHQGELWLVPHAFAPAGNVESDPEACERVRSSLSSETRNRVRLVTGDYDCHELKWLIGKFDFFVGSRMHSCIAALSQGVPCVGIAYSRKFEGVFDTVGMGDWVIDGRKVQNDEAISKILEFYKKRNEIRFILKIKSEQARSQLHETFDNLFSKIPN
ncbi:MAG: polysaccharide pyruvyl transferase family protein, partial [Thermodesulfobacteriota bacterium]